MTEVYEAKSLQFSSENNISLLLIGITEILRALEIISKQLKAINEKGEG